MNSTIITVVVTALFNLTMVTGLEKEKEDEFQTSCKIDFKSDTATEGGLG